MTAWSWLAFIFLSHAQHHTWNMNSWHTRTPSEKSDSILLPTFWLKSGRTHWWMYVWQFVCWKRSDVLLEGEMQSTAEFMDNVIGGSTQNFHLWHVLFPGKDYKKDYTFYTLLKWNISEIVLAWQEINISHSTKSGLISQFTATENSPSYKHLIIPWVHLNS